MKSSGAIRAFLLASALVAAPAVWACGYHSPASIARVTLNFVYPNAHQVGSAVWKAQTEGRLSRDSRPEATISLLGYGVAVKDLGRLRDGLSLVRDAGHNDPALSLLLIGPMLWARLAPNGTDLEMTPHTAGPAAGDLVLVTDEPVIKALVEGQVTPQAARELGLMRFYGTPEAMQRATSWLDRLSQPVKSAEVKSSD